MADRNLNLEVTNFLLSNFFLRMAHIRFLNFRQEYSDLMLRFRADNGKLTLLKETEIATLANVSLG